MCPPVCYRQQHHGLQTGKALHLKGNLLLEAEVSNLEREAQLLFLECPDLWEPGGSKYISRHFSGRSVNKAHPISRVTMNRKEGMLLSRNLPTKEWGFQRQQVQTPGLKIGVISGLIYLRTSKESSQWCFPGYSHRALSKWESPEGKRRNHG